MTMIDQGPSPTSYPVKCPECGASFHSPSGAGITCPSCKTTLTITPDDDETPPGAQSGRANERTGRPANPVGAGVSLLAALLVLIGSFTPVHSYGLVAIEKNSFVAGGDWWVIVVALVMGVTATYALLGQGTTRGIVGLSLGSVAAIGTGIYGLTSHFQRLESVLNVTALGFSRSYVTGSPAIGVYLVLVGGILGLAGAGLLTGAWRPAWAPAYATRVRKQCPDCAETVLAEARVCKHCGHRFG